MSATPTDAERELARNLLFPELSNWTPTDLANLQLEDDERMERIAQAFADQRARYEAVADELDDWKPEAEDESEVDWTNGHTWGMKAAAYRIRQVARP